MPPLRQVRRLRGYSLRALATASGLAVATISEIERGETTHPHPQTITAISHALQVDPATISEFTNGDGGPPAHPAQQQ